MHNCEDMITENYFSYEHFYSFLRHSALLKADRKTLLFLHGIGDSSLSFLPFFAASELKDFNILIPDLLGHGKSSKNNDYSFKVQVTAIIKHIQALEETIGFDFENIILIPHSMGAILAIFLCESVIKNRIKGFINIEGTITQYGSFVSETVSKAASQNKFDQWFHEFKESIIFDKFIKEFPVTRSYYASLEFCCPKAFLQNALEMHQLCLASPGKYTNSIGKKFAELNLPKVYCYGDQSLCAESVDFLHENHLPNKVFHSKNHFVMLECFNEFVKFITNWIIKNF
jgi:pimeloyl-ACP methyl ester carboxylesterase